MRRRFRPLPFALLATLAAIIVPIAASASAEERPLAMPRRDVDVEYRSQPPGATAAVRQRVRWDIAGARERIDPPSGNFHVILDFRARRMFSVSDPIRTVLEIDAAGTRLMPDLEHGRFDSAGSAAVAGLACRLWRALPAGPRAVALCVTDDGVLLRVSAGTQVLAEADRVTYGPADPAVFAIPADYRRVAPGTEPKP